MSVNQAGGIPVNDPVATTSSTSSPPVVRSRGKVAALVGSSVKEAAHASKPIAVDDPNKENANPNVSTVPTNPAAITASLASAGTAQAAPTKSDQIIQKFLVKVPKDPSDPDKYLQKGDKRIENAIRDELANPDEPAKTYGTLFADRKEFENFFSLLNHRLDDLRYKREAASERQGKAYTGFNKAFVENQISGLCNDIANNRVSPETIEKAKKELKLPQAVTLDARTQAATEAAPYANFKHNEKALVHVIVDVLADDLNIKPNEDPNFLEAGNADLEKALDKQIKNAKDYLPRYGGLFKDVDQLKAALRDVKEYLELLSRERQEECNRNNTVYNGIPFSEIKTAVEVRIFELGDNKLHKKFVAYALTLTGGPAVKLTYEFVQAQTLAYLKTLAPQEQNKVKTDNHHEIHEHYTNEQSRATSTTIIEQIKKDLEELERARSEMTNEGFSILMHQFYEDYKELIFERKIKEAIEINEA